MNIWARGTDGAVKQHGLERLGLERLGGPRRRHLSARRPPSRAPRTSSTSTCAAAATRPTSASWTPAAGWSAWALLDSTPIDSSPAAGGDGPSHEWLVARGGSGLLLQGVDGERGLGPWTDLGPARRARRRPRRCRTAPPDGEVSLEAGVRCTPPGGKLRVNVTVRKPKGKAERRA